MPFIGKFQGKAATYEYSLTHLPSDSIEAFELYHCIYCIAQEIQWQKVIFHQVTW